MRRPPTLTGSESLALSLVATAALLVVAAYLGDRAGVAFTPARMLAIAILSAASMLVVFGPEAEWNGSETATFAAVVTVTFAWLMWIARPTFFPLGSGPDLTHHLLLINYIEAHWRLVHVAGVGDYLGEMVLYTPGSHILTALCGAWSRSTGLHSMHAVMAASVALKTGFVFLIATRLLPRNVPRVPIAALASISLFASQTYFLGSFAQYSFLAQVIAECFAVAMWWALAVWDQHQGRWLMALVGLSGAALFLTWPILIGPPLVVLGLLVVLPSSSAVRLTTSAKAAVVHRSVRRRRKPDTTYVRQLLMKANDAAVAIVPILVVAALFSIGRMRYVEIAGTGGEAVSPTVRAYGWWFLVLSTAGIAIAMASLKVRTTSRTLALLAGAILLQAAALYLFASARANDPYMARKMFYMLLYPQAVGVALTVGMGWRVFVLSPRFAWALTLIAAIVVARPLVGAPKSLIVAKHPATSIELERAGQWARQHVDRNCVEYLVGDDNTAYWLHLAVLGNPRSGHRTGDNATYELTPALVRWLTRGGLPYAIADLRVLPSDIKSSSDIVAQFDWAAVVKRRGPSACGER